MYPQGCTPQLQEACFPVVGSKFYLSATGLRQEGEECWVFVEGKTSPTCSLEKRQNADLLALSSNSSHGHNQPEIRWERRKVPLPPALKCETAGGNEHTGIPKTKRSPINTQMVRNKIFYPSICSTTVLSNPDRTPRDAFCQRGQLCHSPTAVLWRGER